MTETRETAPQTRFEPLPLPVLVLIVSVAKASDEHFARSCKSEEWRDCDDCVDIYNRAHDQVMSVLDAHKAKVRANVAEEIDDATPPVSIRCSPQEILIAQGMTRARRIARGEQP